MQLSAYRLEQEHFEAYYAKQDVEEIRKLSFYRQTPDKILSFLIDHHIAMERGNVRSISNSIKHIFRHGFMDFKRLREQEIDVLLNYQRRYYELKVQQLQEEIGKLQKILENDSFEQLLHQHQQISEQLFKHRLYLRYHNHERVGINAGNYKQLFNQFVKQYSIMLSTTHSCRMPTVSSNSRIKLACTSINL